MAYCSRQHQRSHWKIHKLVCRPGKGKTSSNCETPSYLEAFPQSQPENKTLECISEFVHTSLVKDHYCVIDSLYSDKDITGLMSEVHQLRKSGVFKDGKLSGGITASEDTQKYTQKKTRDDVLTWIEGSEPNVQHIAKHMNYLDSVIIHSKDWLKQLGYDISGRTKAMVACYPQQASGYRRHVDNPDGDGRCVTALLYLNKDWKESDGGKLRIYQDKGNIDVEPMCNRLLVFWSDSRVPHEVLPAYADRYAITVWYFDAKERASAKQLHTHELNSLQEVREALEEVEKKTKERDSLKERLECATEQVIHNVTEDNVHSLRAILTTYPTPEETQAVFGIHPHVQGILRQILEKREKLDEEQKKDDAEDNK